MPTAISSPEALPKSRIPPNQAPQISLGIITSQSPLHPIPAGRPISSRPPQTTPAPARLDPALTNLG